MFQGRIPRNVCKLSGEHTWMATPVPIPNTAVKHPGPMVVPAGARVGYRRDFKKARWLRPPGFLLAPSLSPFAPRKGVCFRGAKGDNSIKRFPPRQPVPDQNA